MSALVPLPLVLPIVGTALSIIGGRWRNWQRFVSIATLTGVLAVSIALLVEADAEGIVVHRAGG